MFEMIINWWNNLNDFNQCIMLVTLMWIIIAFLGWLYQKAGF